jgi:segregation and condensation protein A
MTGGWHVYPILPSRLWLAMRLCGWENACMGKVVDTLSTNLEEPVHLAAFEGPLDLLLFLVRKNEIDIYDIPIAEVTRQYMEIISKAEEDRLEIAGDFFVLAATLMRIKSRMLLPREIRPDAPEEDGEDPRWELAKMLLEYNRFKAAAGELEVRIEVTAGRLPRLFPDEPVPVTTEAIRPMDRFEVWNIYNAILRRLAERMVQGRIVAEALSVSECMQTIRERLRVEECCVFTSLLPEGELTPMMVAVHFLAMLELARVGALTLSQNAAFDDIILRVREDVPPEGAALAPEADEGEFRFV